VRIVGHSPDGRYSLIKEVITDPHQPTLLIKYAPRRRSRVAEEVASVCSVAPHLAVGGWGNDGNVTQSSGMSF